jgi:hypothetical protein
MESLRKFGVFAQETEAVCCTDILYVDSNLKSNYHCWNTPGGKIRGFQRRKIMPDQNINEIIFKRFSSFLPLFCLVFIEHS